jgi:Ca2+-binding EF-hand superfamily protein
MDTNNDGIVTVEEYVVFYGNMFDASDLNADKKLTAEESKAQAKNKLNEIDANKDGNITRDEYLIYWIGVQK